MSLEEPKRKERGRDLQGRAEVCGVVGVVVVVVSDPFAHLPRQPLLGLLPQLDREKSRVSSGGTGTATRGQCDTHADGGLKAELGQALRGELEVCRQRGLLVGAAEGRLAVGGGRLSERRNSHTPK